ncbi:unnamed protein product [Strongylus vulgaris]|uniref:Fibronectin type-III domain-containing protein n=1 Tax=Strongylus vulgaris TaxID=40348 RepID=A0A3P7INH4_STRVU|nr:unnamed protein product [Strongylus vulgaris]
MNSEATATASVHCTCRPGFYRAENESADRICTQGPNHPSHLHVKDIDQSSAVLEWDEPSSLGGRREVWYEWECSRGDCSEIIATPADKKLMSRTLRLSGLKPDTEYSFNIFAKNSVSFKIFSNTCLSSCGFTHSSFNPICGDRSTCRKRAERWNDPRVVGTSGFQEGEI